MSGAPRAVAITDPASPPDWVAAAGAEPLSSALLEEEARLADVLLVDAGTMDPATAARRAGAVDPAVQVIVVADGARRGSIQRALLLAPGIGEVWIREPGAVTRDLVAEAASVTRRRREYRVTRARIAAEAAAPSPERVARALVSDAYLASLLRVLGDAVFSVDEDGRIVSANPAATKVLGAPERALLGRPLADAFGAPAAHDVRRLLERARTEPASGEVRFVRADGSEGVGELAVAPVGDVTPPVRAAVLHDVTDRQRAQDLAEQQASELEEQAAEMEAAHEELQHALRMRERFYSAMSHELRTPINAILGYLSLALDGLMGPLTPEQTAGLERARRAARHLLELVNDALDLAKIEAGRIELDYEAVSPLAIVEELLDTVRPLADEYGSRLAIEPESCPDRVITDPRRVRQILFNLLSNAIKFGEGKPVTVRCAAGDAGGVVLAVVDRGRGIAAEDLERIFEEFVQVASGGTGTGLGLAISRRLATLLGGRVEVESAPGRGSTFRLVLPPAAPGAAP